MGVSASFSSTEELLALPGLMRELAEVQRRIVEQLSMLGEQVRALAEAQRRTEEQVRVLRGRRWTDDAEAYLIAEVSVGIGEDDVERAVRRAELLHRAIERPVIAAVAGRGITPQASALAREYGVWRILDGTPIAPDEE